MITVVEDYLGTVLCLVSHTSVCTVYLAKGAQARQVFYVLHSLKVFSTNRTAWIWRTGVFVLTDRQTDNDDRRQPFYMRAG